MYRAVLIYTVWWFLEEGRELKPGKPLMPKIIPDIWFYELMTHSVVLVIN